MKRGHTADDYRERIKKLRQVRPNISLSSDFIVAWEMQQQFDETMALWTRWFRYFFSFIYSAPWHSPRAWLMMYLRQQKGLAANPTSTRPCPGGRHFKAW